MAYALPPSKKRSDRIAPCVCVSYMHVGVGVYMYACVYKVCVYKVCVCVCVYIYMYACVYKGGYTACMQALGFRV